MEPIFLQILIKKMDIAMPQNFVLVKNKFKNKTFKYYYIYTFSDVMVF